MSTQNYLKILLSLLLIFLISCDQDTQQIVIQGKLSDPDQGIAVSGAEITLKVIEMANGSWSQNYITKASTTSGEDGSYFFEIPFFYTISYKLEISKSNYFHETIELEENEFDNHSCTRDITLHPKASLKIHLKNDFPFNNQDNIRYRIVNWNPPYEDCCPSTYTEFTGMNIDETVECTVIGSRTYTIEYTYTRNNNTNAGLKTVFCEAFQTNSVEINF